MPRTDWAVDVTWIRVDGGSDSLRNQDEKEKVKEEESHGSVF
jgi:hypothetical protein